MNKRPVILVVDDQPVNIHALNDALTADHRVIAATSGQAALRLVARSAPDLILLDVMMPEMDGVEVCRQLKESPDTSDIPVIFLTARTTPADIVKGFEAGAIDYVTKPFSSEELLSRVRTHLELRRAREELRVLNATKDKFFGIIAHDLRGPFNGLIGLSSLLLKMYHSLNDEDRLDMIGQMKAASESTLALLENLLQWSSAQSGRIVCTPKPVNLSTLATDSTKVLTEMARRKEIDLRCSVAQQATALCDSDLLDTVIRNLVSNALKFTDAGGTVEVASQDAENESEITLVVSDSGVGMEPERMEKLFQLDAPRPTVGTDGEQGTGLGLSLCKDFVDMNGGTIHAESEPGVGTRFFINLPRAPEQQENPAQD